VLNQCNIAPYTSKTLVWSCWYSALTSTYLHRVNFSNWRLTEIRQDKLALLRGTNFCQLSTHYATLFIKMCIKIFFKFMALHFYPQSLLYLRDLMFSFSTLIDLLKQLNQIILKWNSTKIELKIRSNHAYLQVIIPLPCQIILFVVFIRFFKIKLYDQQNVLLFS